MTIVGTGTSIADYEFLKANTTSLKLVCFSGALFLGLMASGCGEDCPAVHLMTGARLTLHLPPQTSVTTPETIKVCRQPDCATAMISTGPQANTPLSLVFTLDPSATDATVGNKVEGWLDLGPGNVRVLHLTWEFNGKSINPASPGNAYDVQVNDTGGAVTGKLAGSIQYEHVTGCGPDAWQGSLSD